MINWLKYYVKQYLFNQTSPFLLYHSIDYEKNITDFSLSDIHNVTPSIFQEQIEFVQQKHKFVFVDTFFDRLKKGKSLKGLACLTFDDGYKSITENCRKYLRDNDIPYTIFLNKKALKGSYLWRDLVRVIINKSLVDDFLKFSELGGQIYPDDFYHETKGGIVSSEVISSAIEKFFDSYEIKTPEGLYLNVDEVEELVSDDNCMVGNHTISHFVLTDLSNEQLEIEIIDNHKFLNDKFEEKKISQVFSVPFGGGDTFDPIELTTVIEKLNYKGYLTTKGQLYSSVSDLQINKGDIPGYGRFLPREIKFEDKL